MLVLQSVHPIAFDVDVVLVVLVPKYLFWTIPEAQIVEFVMLNETEVADPTMMPKYEYGLGYRIP